VSKLIELYKKSPALAIGVVGAAILAALQQLSGDGIIGADIVATLGNLVGTAEAPGPLVLILAAIVTRFAVFSPNTVATQYVKL